MDTIALIILPIGLVLPIITLIIPWPHGWRLCSVYALFFAALMISSPEARDKGFAYALGMMIFIGFGIAISVILALKFAMHRYMNARFPNAPDKAYIPHQYELLFCVLLGIPASCIMIYYIGFAFEGSAHGYIIHLITTCTALIIARNAYQHLYVKKAEKLQYPATFLLTCSSIIALFSIVGLCLPSAIVYQAKHIAQNNAYCLALNETQEATLEDMSFYTMPKNNYNRHATLLVQQENNIAMYYWSFRLFEFVAYADATPIRCKPRHDYADILRHKRDSSSTHDYYFKGTFLHIPAEYAPSVTRDYMSIAVQAPDFHVIPKVKRHLYPSIEFRSREWIENLVTNSTDTPPESIFKGTWSDLKNAKSLYTKYFIYDENQRLLSVISCHGLNCGDYFYRNGAMFSFDFPSSLLKRTEEMENNLVHLLESFGLKPVFEQAPK